MELLQNAFLHVRNHFNMSFHVLHYGISFSKTSSFFTECVKALIPCGGCQRSLFRDSYRLKGNLVADIVISLCCAPCSAVQMYNEAKYRGESR